MNIPTAVWSPRMSESQQGKVNSCLRMLSELSCYSGPTVSVAGFGSRTPSDNQNPRMLKPILKSSLERAYNLYNPPKYLKKYLLIYLFWLL